MPDPISDPMNDSNAPEHYRDNLAQYSSLDGTASWAGMSSG